MSNSGLLKAIFDVDEIIIQYSIEPKLLHRLKLGSLDHCSTESVLRRLFTQQLTNKR